MASSGSVIDEFAKNHLPWSYRATIERAAAGGSHHADLPGIQSAVGSRP